jgi:hypothetical protein
LAGSLSQEVEAGAEEPGVVLGAGAAAGVLEALSLPLEGAFVSDEAAPFPDSDAAPDPDADPVSDPDSEAGALLLAA